MKLSAEPNTLWGLPHNVIRLLLPLTIQLIYVIIRGSSNRESPVSKAFLDFRGLSQTQEREFCLVMYIKIYIAKQNGTFCKEGEVCYASNRFDRKVQYAR